MKRLADLTFAVPAILLLATPFLIIGLAVNVAVLLRALCALGVRRPVFRAKRAKRTRRHQIPNLHSS
jgi:hypothetical protein